jgi:hypothetical protein
VSTLVSDPTDPDVSRRWKLFVHRYFWEPKRDGMFTHGWIVLRTAADPAGDWSEEVPLFGAGRNPPAPYNKTRVDLNALDESLKNTVAYSEPGALADRGRLYLSLSALRPSLGFTGFSPSYRIILVASDDHGATRHVLGTRRRSGVLRRAQHGRRAHHATVQPEGVPGGVSDFSYRPKDSPSVAYRSNGASKRITCRPFRLYTWKSVSVVKT